MTELAHELACTAVGTITLGPQYCHQPQPQQLRNPLTEGDKDSITGSPSIPAFSGSPVHAPSLSKALELMPDKGKTIKKKKKSKGAGGGFERDASSLGLLAFLAEKLNFYSFLISL